MVHIFINTYKLSQLMTTIQIGHNKTNNYYNYLNILLNKYNKILQKCSIIKDDTTSDTMMP